MITKDQLSKIAQTLDGMPILGALPGSPIDLAGIRFGDVLLSVNGQRVRTIAEYVAARLLVEGAMFGTYWRDGKEVGFDVSWSESDTTPEALLPTLKAMRLFDDSLEGPKQNKEMAS